MQITVIIFFIIILFIFLFLSLSNGEDQKRIAGKVGNDTYTENRYRYNYTQIMNDFFTATNDNKAKLEDVVNSISPAGATLSDFAMELALKQINKVKMMKVEKMPKELFFL